MPDREFLLLEAIRRLDTAYHQLWGAVCEIKPEWKAGSVFNRYYKQFSTIMERVSGEIVPLVLAPCGVCRDPNCPEPNAKH